MKISNGHTFLLIIIAGYIFFQLFCPPPLEEDAYIYFRFAENIAQGNGYVFNPGGEKIEGCSSLTWLFLLALLNFFGCNVLITPKILGILLGSCSLIIIYKISGCFTQAYLWRLFPVVLTALSLPFLMRNQMGLEDPLYSLVFLSLVFVCLDEKRFQWWPALFFLLAITRPEGMFMAPAMLPVFYFYRKKRHAIGYGIALVFLLMCILFSVRLLYFHDFLPSPFYFKIFPGKFKYGLTYAHGFLKNYFMYFFIAPVFLFIFKKSNWTPKRTILFTFILVHCIWIVTEGACFFPFYRHFVHIIPLIYIYIISGAVNLFRKDSLPGKVIVCSTLCIFGFSALLLPQSNWSPWNTGPNFIVSTIKNFYAQPQRYMKQLFQKTTDPRFDHTHKLHSQTLLGRFIKNNYFPGTTFLYDQMGRLPYNAGPEYIFIDSNGLIDKSIGHAIFDLKSRDSKILEIYNTLSREIIHTLYPANGTFLSRRETLAYIHEKNPDVILCFASMRIMILKQLGIDPLFKKWYTLRHSICGVLFFEKKGLKTKAFSNPDKLPIVSGNEAYKEFKDHPLIKALNK